MTVTGTAESKFSFSQAIQNKLHIENRTPPRQTIRCDHGDDGPKTQLKPKKGCIHFKQYRRHKKRFLRAGNLYGAAVAKFFVIPYLNPESCVLVFLLVGCFGPARLEDPTRTRVSQKEDMAMRNPFDMGPFVRSTIGFDRLLNQLEIFAEPERGYNYPPYNIEKLGEDRYRVALAVAGFTENELSVTVQANQLTVAGKKADVEQKDLLYRGIAHRPFMHQFSLANFVVVTDAKLANGLLTIELERQLPEAMKPRRIAINGPTTPPTETRRAA